MVEQNNQFGQNSKFYLDPEIYFDKPVLIELNPDGTLNLDPGLLPPDRIQVLAERLEPAPIFDEGDSVEFRAEVRARYQCLQVVKVYPTLKEILAMHKLNEHSGTYWREFKGVLSELGSEVQEILTAASRRCSLEEISVQQWGKYGCSISEISELELIGAKRREISLRRANWETSRDFSLASSSEKALKAESFDKELRDATSPLWTILHLGVNYLSTVERIAIQSKVLKSEVVSRADLIERKLLELRLAYLERYRKDRANFKLPVPKS